MMMMIIIFVCGCICGVQAVQVYVRSVIINDIILPSPVNNVARQVIFQILVMYLYGTDAQFV